jgi:hypothetical protein
MEPRSNKPKTSQADIIRGYLTRYFVQNVSSNVITEVDGAQYENLKTYPKYKRLQLKWVITGYANDILASDGTRVYGAEHQNKTTTEWYSAQMPGLTKILRNPLEYFVGRYAKTENLFSKIIPPRVTPPTSIDAPPSTPTTTTTTVSPESLPLYSLSLTDVIGRFDTILEVAYILQANSVIPLSFRIVDTLEAVGYSDEVCGTLSGETVTVNGMTLFAGQFLTFVPGSAGMFTFDTNKYKITNTPPLTIQIGDGTPTPRLPNVVWVEAGYRWTINYSFGGCQLLPFDT